MLYKPKPSVCSGKSHSWMLMCETFRTCVFCVFFLNVTVFLLLVSIQSVINDYVFLKKESMTGYKTQSPTCSNGSIWKAFCQEELWYKGMKAFCQMSALKLPQRKALVGGGVNSSMLVKLINSLDLENPHCLTQAYELGHSKGQSEPRSKLSTLRPLDDPLWQLSQSWLKMLWQKALPVQTAVFHVV